MSNTTGLTSSERGEAAVMSRAEPSVGYCLSSTSPSDFSAAPAGARDRDRSLRPRPSRPRRRHRPRRGPGAPRGGRGGGADGAHPREQHRGSGTMTPPTPVATTMRSCSTRGATRVATPSPSVFRQLRGRRGRRLRRRGLRGGWQRGRVSIHHRLRLHGPDGAERASRPGSCSSRTPASPSRRTPTTWW